MEYKIEKNIPIPESVNSKLSRFFKVLSAMEVGDSVLIEVNRASSLYAFKKQNAYKGIKFKTQSQGDGTRRVWRIA